MTAIVAAADADRPSREAFGLTALAALMLAGATLLAQDQAPNRREVVIVAGDHQFVPNRIEVAQDDLVRVSLRSEDQAYSFAVDAYRILKRVGGKQTITFEFRADQAGAFTFYCNLTSDAQCRDMKGTLAVKPR